MRIVNRDSTRAWCPAICDTRAAIHRSLLTIHGCLADKDVYVEKPASHNIVEGQVAVAAARKHDRIVQLGTQLRSAQYLQQAVQYVQSGSLGKVIYGKAWETDRSGEVRLAANSSPVAGR